MVLEWILGATLLVSLVSFVGALTLPLKEKTTTLLLTGLVSFATGTMLGAAFLDVLPEAIETIEPLHALQVALAGIVIFFIVEKIIYWHHHHGTHGKEEKPLAYLNLIGDGIHNFFDGAAIAASFLSGTEIGIAATLAIILHEVPQEMGDFSLLLYSGLTKTKALFFNFLSALSAILGALIFYYFASSVKNLEGIGLAFAGGMFIYIATADLLPEIQKETEIKKSIGQLALILLGIATIGAITTFLE